VNSPDTACVGFESAYELVTRQLTKFTGYAPRAGSADWRCPAHDDSTASLSVTVGIKGVVLHCHAGCETSKIVKAIGLAMHDLFDSSSYKSPISEILSTYEYCDENGELLFQVVRYPNKKFLQRRPNGQGSWEWKLGDSRKVLYRLPKVLEAVASGQPVFICEGEKDADAVVRAGFCGTTNPGGASTSENASKWRQEYSECLRGAVEVYICADNDRTGFLHARCVRRSLARVGIDAPVVHTLDGKDISDHLGAGRPLDDLEELTDTVLDQLCGSESTLKPEVDPQDSKELRIEPLADLVNRVRNSPGPRFLFGGVWAEGDYGVFSAEDKAGKSWTAMDAGISVATGTPWLSLFKVEAPGAVLMFLGEGSGRKVERRMSAIAESRGHDITKLPIRVCLRVPHLSNRAHLDILEDEVSRYRPKLIVIDPFYLAARGAKSQDLFAMGELLEGVQHLAQSIGAALLVTHHWNKTGEGTGARRMTGVGPSAWGRVLVSAAKKKTFTDPDTKETVVMLEMEFQGDEIAEQTIYLRRRVWADNPADLKSAMHYEVSPIEGLSAPTGDPTGLRPSTQKVLAVLSRSTEAWESVRTIGDQLAEQGGPLKDRTIQDALQTLKKRNLVECEDTVTGSAGLWRRTRAGSDDSESESEP
jgi:hypothetical protein